MPPTREEKKVDHRNKEDYVLCQSTIKTNLNNILQHVTTIKISETTKIGALHESS